ncbi:MAG: DNA repair protein RecO [Candidatus Levybacteria bacterium RIFCSPLOWO2_01_FULL_39_24]|nr:MAG: DNA repair protein RecO [Candidatus Levybacteria bacterium RIFCSPHIGHO2_01_FULL_40_16]OGH28323.1 MAG: DNA repair protein RecO [Candidatus Levybacteria bacterium RIFCSPHIGHO2_12_FULL_39_9]OGH46191.1 MAG: DNA repair protein RecO [Candidatus Levybacteria bacterium RIFCSPLOWO2_01_FULL_39_24]
MRTYRIEGIVLRRRNLGEADRILTILSKESGKIVVKAPGVRRIHSRRSSHIELLNFSEFTLYSGSKTFMPIVTEAQIIDDFSRIKKDLHKIGVAYYICELINGLCADNQENRGVFFHLKASLSELSGTLDTAVLIKKFEKDLLTELGFWSEAKLLQTQDSQIVMERLLERKLKTLRVLPLFTP